MQTLLVRAEANLDQLWASLVCPQTAPSFKSDAKNICLDDCCSYNNFGLAAKAEASTRIEPEILLQQASWTYETILFNRLDQNLILNPYGDLKSTPKAGICGKMYIDYGNESYFVLNLNDQVTGIVT